MFSVLARGERTPATLLLAEVLPRRQRAHRDERVGGNRATPVVLLVRASASARATASSLLCARVFTSCHSRCLLLLYNFSADIGVFKKLLVAELDVYIPRLDPVLVCNKRKIPKKFVGSVIRHFGVAKQRCCNPRGKNSKDSIVRLVRLLFHDDLTEGT